MALLERHQEGCLVGEVLVMDDGGLPGYRHRAVGFVYDNLNRLLWLPHGSDRLRRELVERIHLGPGASVLELGCGTGLVTRHLCGARAEVTAVDGAPAMLTRARRRAPGATFIQRDLGADLPLGPFDAAVLAFVLHELDPSARSSLVRRAAAVTVPRGRLAILEWATPAPPRRAAVWRRVVRTIEPAVAHDVLDDGLDTALRAAGVDVTDDVRVAGGRARIVLTSAA